MGFEVLDSIFFSWEKFDSRLCFFILVRPYPYVSILFFFFF